MENKSVKLSKYEPKLDKIMYCLSCDGKIMKHNTSDISPYQYICPNGKTKTCKSMSSSVVCENLDKLITNKLEELYSFFHKNYRIDIIEDKNDKLEELYKQRLKILKKIENITFFVDRKQRDFYLEAENLQQIEEKIELIKWKKKFNEKKKPVSVYKESAIFTDIILEYTNIQISLKDKFGIITFKKTPFTVDFASNNFIPYIFIKFSWVSRKGRKPSSK